MSGRHNVRLRRADDRLEKEDKPINPYKKKCICRFGRPGLHMAFFFVLFFPDREGGLHERILRDWVVMRKVTRLAE